MKKKILTKLQVESTKRLFWMGFSYFLSGMVFGGLTGSWWMAGLIGAGTALTRVSIALSKQRAYGRLTEEHVDTIIRKQLDVSDPEKKTNK
jgi:hypothetical protein